MKTFKFIKESNRWFIELSEWKGDKDDLEMVCGADIMLDILAQGELVVYLSISEYKFEESDFTLTFIKEINDGGLYNLDSTFHSFEVWLCHVTKFVFNGKFPKILYCK